MTTTTLRRPDPEAPANAEAGSLFFIRVRPRLGLTATDFPVKDRITAYRVYLSMIWAENQKDNIILVCERTASGKVRTIHYRYPDDPNEVEPEDDRWESAGDYAYDMSRD